MLTVTIEPSIFAPPSNKATAEAIRGYVSALLHWKSVLDSGFARLLACTTTCDVLIRSGAYPFRPLLRELLSDAYVTEYDFNTIAVVAETLMGRSGQLESAASIRDILTSDDTVIQPNVLADHFPEALRAEAEKCLMIVAIIRTISRDPQASGYALALKSDLASKVVSVDARIDIIDHTRADLERLPLAPSRFRGDAIVCRSFPALLQTLDGVALWKSASSGADMETAIRVAVYKSRTSRGAAANWTERPRFRVDDRFYDTACRCGALTTDSLARSALRSIVEAVEDLQMASVHALRTGPGPEERQQARGKDLAWRRDITYEHHLHYWRCSDGSTELSCMVAHNCFDIFR